MFSSLGVCSVNSNSGGCRVLVCCARSHGQPRSAESSRAAKLFALDPVDWKPWQWVDEEQNGRDVQGNHSLGGESWQFLGSSHADCHAPSCAALSGRRRRHSLPLLRRARWTRLRDLTLRLLFFLEFAALTKMNLSTWRRCSA